VPTPGGYYVPPSPTEGPTPFVIDNPPTPIETFAPTNVPTRNPSNYPTKNPTSIPTIWPTRNPTKIPTTTTTYAPTRNPTRYPTGIPTIWPTRYPTSIPTQGGYDQCETAFAYDPVEGMSQCFIGMTDSSGKAITRWGFAVGPYNPSTNEVITLEIWAAAGQCDLSKGTLVGELTISRDPQTCIITIQYIGDNALFTETHLYVGETLMFTVQKGKKNEISTSVGLYPYSSSNKNGETIVTFTIEQEQPCDDPFYVTAHAVVCF